MDKLSCVDIVILITTIGFSHSPQYICEMLQCVEFANLRRILSKIQRLANCPDSGYLTCQFAYLYPEQHKKIINSFNFIFEITNNTIIQSLENGDDYSYSVRNNFAIKDFFKNGTYLLHNFKNQKTPSGFNLYITGYILSIIHFKDFFPSSDNKYNYNTIFEGICKNKVNYDQIDETLRLRIQICFESINTLKEYYPRSILKLLFFLGILYSEILVLKDKTRYEQWNAIFISILEEVEKEIDHPSSLHDFKYYKTLKKQIFSGVFISRKKDYLIKNITENPKLIGIYAISLDTCIFMFLNMYAYPIYNWSTNQ